MDPQNSTSRTEHDKQIHALIARLLRELERQEFLIQLREQKRLELLRHREEAA